MVRGVDNPSKDNFVLSVLCTALLTSSELVEGQCNGHPHPMTRKGVSLP